jgi:hypothetical protein
MRVAGARKLVSSFDGERVLEYEGEHVGDVRSFEDLE